MNKSLFASDIDVPPLCMLSLATLSLILNLCFPQYSASASTRKQRFIAENGLKESKNSIYNIKVSQKNAKEETKSESIAENQSFSELKLEEKVATTPKVATAKKNARIEAVVTDANNNTKTSSRWVTVTAYSSTVDQCDSSPFITASGTHVRDGVIATNLLAFGTKVKFPSLYGDKVFVVEDRMNQRYSNRADIWFATREEAKKFGVKKLEMVIVS